MQIGLNEIHFKKKTKSKISGKIKRKINDIRHRRKKQKTERIGLKKQLFFIPSLITSGNILCGLWSIFICITTTNIEAAIVLIALAGILDAFDGRTARFLGVSGKFGVELDSLADFISFGIAPMIIYFHSYDWNDKIFAYAILSMFPLCMALRLAKFNMLALEPIKDKRIADFRKNFFFGLAAPVGAIALLSPLVLNLIDVCDFRNMTYALIYAFVISLLLVIPVPIFSHKMLHLGFKKNIDTAITIFVFLFIVFFIYSPLYCLLTIAILYTASIPVSIVLYNKGIAELEKQYHI